MLFLKSVIKISVSTIETDGSHHNILSILTENADEVITERKKLTAPLLGDPENFFELCQTSPNNLPAVSYIHRIKTEIDFDNSEETLHSTWRVASLLRVDKKGELLSVINELREQNEKAVPWAGAAARIKAESTSDQVKPFVGKSYCFLPLSENGLPIHINGFFDLDSSRSKTSAGNMSGRDESRVRWNQLLVRHVLSHACANLISDLVCDIGETDPNHFYSFWAIDGIKDKALEELPICLVEILNNREVIATTNQKKWLEPSQIWILPPNFQDLTVPLSADGIALPDPPVPQAILDVFAKADLALSVFLPGEMRKHLRMQVALGLALEEAPKASLRQLSWIKDLLKYCLSDGHRDLGGLPLAVLSDGMLQVFGYNPCGYIYDGKEDVREIFSSHREWFIDQDFIDSISGLRECISITKMNAVSVAERLVDIIDDCHNNEPWEPNGDGLPNAEWLASVYKYLASQKTLPVQQLKKVPLVPGNDGKLHQGGNSLTPLWCDSSVDDDMREMLEYFDIQLLEAPEILSSVIEKFIYQHSEKFIWELTVPDLIDTLNSYNQNLPPYEKYFYELLLTFFCDKTWLKGKGKDDMDRQTKLSKLRIYPTQNEQLVSIENENIFIARGFDVPNLDLGIQFFKLGENEEWYPLFRFLGVKELGVSDLISNYLLSRFSSLGQEQQLLAMRWLRDNTQTIANDSSLKQKISNALLVRSQDDQLHSATKLYSPKCKAIRDLNLTNVPMPLLDFYATDEEDRENWLRFFKDIGMHGTVPPKKVASYLKTSLNWDVLKGNEWNPQGEELPNATWLARIYEYFSSQPEIPNTELREIPLVPGNDRKLHYGGYANTPLWSNAPFTDSINKMLAYFCIPLVEANESLKLAITKFFNCPSQELIFPTTTSDLIDVLDNISITFPAYSESNREYYRTLVSFLADEDWIEGEGKEDRERHEILRKLKVYPTVTDELVALTDPNIFTLGADKVPEVSGNFKLLQLGSSKDKQNWKPLFSLLNVPVLNRAKLIKDFLIPNYKSFSPLDQRNALKWIRDNLSLAQTEQEIAGDSSNDLEKLIRETPLILCEDDQLRSAVFIYHPQSYDLACEILKDLVHTPNVSFYKEGDKRWKKFFHDLRMQHSPAPRDLLLHVQALIKSPRSEDLDHSLMKVL